MQTFRKRLALLTAGLGLFVATANDGFAQFQINQTPRYVNLNPGVAPGLTLQQYLYNVRSVGQAYQNIPPYLLGYNPYRPPVVINTPGINPVINPIVNPTVPYINPYANPYTPGVPIASTGGYGTNPYLPGASGYDASGANPYTPYYEGGLGGHLRGTADVMRAHSSGILSAEQARILREQARRERIKTTKELAEFDWWLKANTPSFAEVQAKIDRDTLKRIQSTNNLPEIWGGKSLNILLDDLRKHVFKTMSMEPLVLPEDVLKHLNVTGEFGNLGLLGITGRFEWPSALQEVLSKDERKEIEDVAQHLINQALHNNGKVDAAALRNLRAYLDKMDDKLSKKVNELRTSDYLNAKRFVADFGDAHVAIEKNQAVGFFKFQEFVRKGPKTVQEVIDYMVKNGLRFSRATTGGEAAYQAMHTAMVAYDLIFNTHVAAATPAPGEEKR